jgi:DNA-binding NarL/FixJ family response regulator
LFAERAILAGASGYLMKDEAAEVLFSAMEAVLGGGMWVSPALAERLLPASVVDRLPPLSALDEEHLPLLRELRAGNRTVLGLSRALGLGPERVERALDRLGADLSLPSRVSIYLYLHRH